MVVRQIYTWRRWGVLLSTFCVMRDQPWCWYPRVRVLSRTLLESMNMVGLLPLLALIKFPIARDSFCLELEGRRGAVDRVGHVHAALVAAALRFRDAVSRKRLLFEMDSVKGPSKCHGFGTMLQKLGIARKSDKGVVCLNVSGQRFELMPCSSKVRG